MEKPCNKPNQIRNPVPPHRCIKIGGPTYLKLVKEGKISVSSSKASVVQPDLNIMEKPCTKPNQIRNPVPPHRCIKIGGPTYLKLVKEGKISVSSQASVVQPVLNIMKKPCTKPNQIRNPVPPHRCITIGGATYLKLVREGKLKVELEHKNFLSEQTYNQLKVIDSGKDEKSPSPKKVIDSGKDEKSPSPKKVIDSGKDEIKLHSDIELLLENTELSAYDTVEEQKSILKCLGLLSA
jgi:hypothetical protein